MTRLEKHVVTAAAVFGLEELEHAKKRGAKVIGELVGFASGSDRKMAGPGYARVIRNALADAGIQPADVDHVNAHGSGTVPYDIFEAKAIGEVFGRDVPVFAPASYFGSTGAAAGVEQPPALAPIATPATGAAPAKASGCTRRRPLP